jgi:hypothetical protein
MHGRKPGVSGTSLSETNDLDPKLNLEILQRLLSQMHANCIEMGAERFKLLEKSGQK